MCEPIVPVAPTMTACLPARRRDIVGCAFGDVVVVVVSEVKGALGD